jgi:hypothetical protein
LIRFVIPAAVPECIFHPVKRYTLKEMDTGPSTGMTLNEDHTLLESHVRFSYKQSAPRP